MRIVTVTPEEFAAMLSRTGWTKELIDIVYEAESLPLPPACPLCGEYISCVHEGNA